MKILVDARWDDDARVWVAAARGDIGLVTEAPTIEDLECRIALVAPDLLRDEANGPFEIELIARRSRTIVS